ncbi:hypothetical protein WJX73_005749 [Symbiochloris irregularis]|uniref:LMBR1-like membrane protein n=1 Tax=Symbiochloris irregularis TaxID=706552 RepID=A0AAW1PFN7_9CHLO
MWSFYVPAMVAVTAAVIVLLRRYAAPTMPYLPRIVTAVAWVTSIGIVALVPIDIWSTMNKTSRKSVSVIWSTAYWTTQALTWFTIPFLQAFLDSGDFTFLKRVRSSLKANLTYYLLIGSAGLVGILFLLLSGRLSFKELLPLGITLSNTYGLIACLLLLGYGLVRIPRSFWRESDPEASLRVWLHRLVKAAEKLRKARVEMLSVATVIEATSAPMSSRDKLRPLMNIIYKQAEEEAPIKPGQALRDNRGRVNMDDLTDAELDYGCDEQGLANLRARLKKAINSYNGKASKYVTAVRVASELELICKCRANGLATYEAGTPSKQTETMRKLQRAWIGYQCLVQPYVFKLVALFLAVFSILIVWSEVTIGFGDLSPFSHIVQDSPQEEVLTQTENGLRNGEKLVFAQKMGRALADVDILGNQFNTWFPITLFFWCLVLVLDVAGTLSRTFLPMRWRFDLDAMSDESVERGKLVLREEQDAQAQGQPVGAALIGEGNKNGSVAAAQGASKGQMMASLTPASSHPSNRSRSFSAEPDPEAALGSTTTGGGLLGRWRQPPQQSPLIPGPSGAASQSPSPSPPGKGPAAVSGMSALTRGLLRNKHGSSESVNNTPGGANAGNSSSLDGIFARMNNGRHTDRIDDDDGEDSGRGGLLGGASRWSTHK